MRYCMQVRTAVGTRKWCGVTMKSLVGWSLTGRLHHPLSSQFDRPTPRTVRRACWAAVIHFYTRLVKMRWCPTTYG